MKIFNCLTANILLISLFFSQISTRGRMEDCSPNGTEKPTTISRTNDGTDPFNPVNNIFFQNSFFMDWHEFKDDRFYNITSAGGYIIFSENQLVTGIEIPYVVTDVTFKKTSGLGDIIFRTRYIINRDLVKSSLFGLDLILPAASKKELGLGKFVLAPAAGINFYTDFGFIGAVLKNYFSVAGNKDRVNVNELSLQPLVKIELGNGWYTLIKPDIRQNWETNRIFLPYTQEFGKMINKNCVLASSFGGHILNRDRKYDWSAELKFSYLWNE